MPTCTGHWQPQSSLQSQAPPPHATTKHPHAGSSDMEAARLRHRSSAAATCKQDDGNVVAARQRRRSSAAATRLAEGELYLRKVEQVLHGWVA
jgi:hypothetical protein